MARIPFFAFALLACGWASTAPAQTGSDVRFEVRKQDDDFVRLRIERDWDDNGHDSWGDRIPLADLKGMSREAIAHGGPVSFSYVRPAGRFDCSGTARDEHAEGNCTFTVNDAFAKVLAARNIERPSRRQYYGLAISGVDSDVIDAVIKEGLGTPTPDELIGLGIFHVTPDFVRGMAHLNGMNVSIGDLVQFRIFKITPELAKDYANLGYGKLSAHDLVQFSIFHVSPETIRGFKEAGYRDLSAHDLQQFSIFHVTPDYIHELADAGYRNIPAETLVRMRMFGVTPAFIRNVTARGNGNGKPSPEELVRMRMMPQMNWARDWQRNGRGTGSGTSDN